MKKYSHFSLFSCCKIVKGHKQSTIIDVQKNEYHIISNLLSNFLIKNPPISVNETQYKFFENEIQNLYNKELGFFTNQPKSFPPINNNWYNASEITNVIIELDSESSYLSTKLFRQIDNLSCQSLQLNIFFNIDIKLLRELLEYVNFSRIRSVELNIKYNDALHVETLAEISDIFQRISLIVVFQSPKTNLFKLNSDVDVYYTEQMISFNNCGNISKNYFSISSDTFLESQHHNTCLNRKISIDTNGEIKNCPSMQKSYGNIKDTTLEEALNKQGFKDLWSIKKEDIKVCQDCEFRHICTDCRAFIDNPNDIYSRPAKCTYNPYLAKWKGEERYISVVEMTKKEIEKIKIDYAEKTIN